jgi:hypothetical protein
MLTDFACLYTYEFDFPFVKLFGKFVIALISRRFYTVIFSYRSLYMDHVPREGFIHRLLINRRVMVISSSFYNISAIYCGGQFVLVEETRVLTH